MDNSNRLSERFGLWSLAAVVIGLGILFYKIIEPFLIPLFFAAMLAVLFRPWFERAVEWAGGRHRAAAVMTVLTLLILLLPLGGALFLAGRELAAVGEQIMKWDASKEPLVQHVKGYWKAQLSTEAWEQLQDSLRSGIRDITAEIFDRTQVLLANVIRFVVGLAIMGLALYYFFSDGPQILRTLRAVSPLEGEDEKAVFEQFGRVCRGVIIGTVVCAAAQAGLLGVGLVIVGISGIWLLMGLTFFCSMIPFLGAAAIWVPATIWLISVGEYGSAVFLGLYGGGIVSTSDNLIRAYVLKGAADMHPLVALISVIGAIQLVGMWGIFLGPIAAALFYTLLKLLNMRLVPEDPMLKAMEARKPE